MDKFQQSSGESGVEQCYCIGRQWVDGVLQSACPCAMRSEQKAIEAFQEGKGKPYIDPVKE